MLDLKGAVSGRAMRVQERYINAATQDDKGYVVLYLNGGNTLTVCRESWNKACRKEWQFDRPYHN